MNKKYLNLVSSVLILGLFFQFTPSVWAIGVSPAKVVLNNMLSENEVEVMLRLTNSNSDIIQEGEVVISGEVVPYIELVNGSIVDLKESVNMYPIRIKPSGLKPGDYKGMFSVTPVLSSEAAQKGGSIVLPGTTGDIHFSITDQPIESYHLSDVSIVKTPPGEPIGFAYRLNNEGNVPAKPGKVELSIQSRLHPEIHYKDTLTAEELPMVQPFSENRSFLHGKTPLDSGIYLVTLVIYDEDNQPIFELDEKQIQIGEGGVLPQPRQEASTKKGVIFWFLGLIGLVAIVVVGVEFNTGKKS